MFPTFLYPLILILSNYIAAVFLFYSSSKDLTEPFVEPSVNGSVKYTWSFFLSNSYLDHVSTTYSLIIPSPFVIDFYKFPNASVASLLLSPSRNVSVSCWFLSFILKITNLLPLKCEFLSYITDHQKGLKRLEIDCTQSQSQKLHFQQHWGYKVTSFVVFYQRYCCQW